MVCIVRRVPNLAPRVRSALEVVVVHLQPIFRACCEACVALCRENRGRLMLSCFLALMAFGWLALCRAGSGSGFGQGPGGGRSGGSGVRVRTSRC